MKRGFTIFQTLSFLLNLHNPDENVHQNGSIPEIHCKQLVYSSLAVIDELT